MNQNEKIKNDLSTIIDSARIILKEENMMDELLFNSYGADRTKLFKPKFQLLLFPKNTEEVAAIIKYCFKHKLSVVPSGGRTGYAGGAMAINNEIVISLDKMNLVIDFDPFLGSITVQAGMITANLHREAEKREFYFPVDFAATGSSHIGGNIATNAGGVRVVYYGLIRNWVLGLTVVTGTGEVIKLNGEILKNNTGYDLKQLFIGSEGTLGIITETTLKLTKKPLDYKVVLLSVEQFSHILEIFKETHNFRLNLLAFEFFTSFCMDKVRHHLGLPDPFAAKSNYYVLAEFETIDDNDENKLFALIESIAEKELILDGSIAQNSRQNQTFWKYREGISESISIDYTVHKNDISIPLRNMENFIIEMETILKEEYPDFGIALFGHIGDGNLHLNILKPESMAADDFFTKCKNVDKIMFALIQKYHGSISAEHGIGLLKKDFLSFSRSEYEINLMKEIKKAFDPAGIMNPGKVL